MSVKEHAKNPDVWIRGLFILIFAVIFYVLYIVIWLLVIIQFITKVVTGNLNDNLSEFSAGATRYAFQILLYITFQSEERPFPFSPWPQADKSLPAASSGESAGASDADTPADSAAEEDENKQE